MRVVKIDVDLSKKELIIPKDIPDCIRDKGGIGQKDTGYGITWVDKDDNIIISTGALV